VRKNTPISTKGTGRGSDRGVNAKKRDAALEVRRQKARGFESRIRICMEVRLQMRYHPKMPIRKTLKTSGAYWLGIGLEMDQRQT